MKLICDEIGIKWFAGLISDSHWRFINLINLQCSVPYPFHSQSRRELPSKWIISLNGSISVPALIIFTADMSLHSSAYLKESEDARLPAHALPAKPKKLFPGSASQNVCKGYNYSAKTQTVTATKPVIWRQGPHFQRLVSTGTLAGRARALAPPQLLSCLGVSLDCG